MVVERNVSLIILQLQELFVKQMETLKKKSDSKTVVTVFQNDHLCTTTSM